MAADETETGHRAEKPRERRRLKLMESYGAFRDDRLQNVAETIRGMTAGNGPQPYVLRANARRSIGDSIGDSIGSPNGSPNGSPPHAGILLTENQATLYCCLQQINEAVTSLSRIARATGISEHTLKSCLKKLRQAALIHYDGRRHGGGRVGFTATTSLGFVPAVLFHTPRLCVV